jgi:hypothetical protein
MLVRYLSARVSSLSAVAIEVPGNVGLTVGRLFAICDAIEAAPIAPDSWDASAEGAKMVDTGVLVTTLGAGAGVAVTVVGVVVKDGAAITGGVVPVVVAVGTGAAVVAVPVGV